jgi:1-acyl-sn-glycerol-3-phosphate acyltransferase
MTVSTSIASVLGSRVPRRGNAFSRAVARLGMRVSGWRFEGEFPDLPQFVVIVAPHTSNWDFVLGVMAMFAIGLRGTFLGKDTLFRWPFRVVMRWLGGVPVDRFSPHNVVEQTTGFFRAHDQLVLALSPEGTRKKLPEWRTGFWYVAKGAGVPIVPVALDFSRRVFRIFPPVVPGASREEGFERLHELFDARMARHPERY